MAASRSRPLPPTPAPHVTVLVQGGYTFELEDAAAVIVAQVCSVAQELNSLRVGSVQVEINERRIAVRIGRNLPPVLLRI